MSKRAKAVKASRNFLKKTMQSQIEKKQHQVQQQLKQLSQQKQQVTSRVISMKNPFEEAAQTSNLSYGVYMMERNAIRQRRLE